MRTLGGAEAGAQSWFHHAPSLPYAKVSTPPTTKIVGTIDPAGLEIMEMVPMEKSRNPKSIALFHFLPVDSVTVGFIGLTFQ